MTNDQMAKFHFSKHKTLLILNNFYHPKINNMSKITKTINICFCLALASFFACKEAPKNNAPTDEEAITDVVHNFYKWYSSGTDEAIQYVDIEGEFAKLDMAKVAAYHAQLMNSGFLTKAYVDNDLAILEEYAAIWAKDKETGREGPLTGYDYNRVFCGQDWTPETYTTGPIQIEMLGANRAKAVIESTTLELVKENGKWLISKNNCF